ncbi:MAG: hypothetical protein AAFQ87_06100 [Bacteroidota bacterium]
MSRTISLASQIELPSLHRVFALQKSIPAVSDGPCYWSVTGQYVLGQKQRILYGLTNASQQEEKSLQRLHQALRRYYAGRLDISGLNRAQEGLYFHQEDISEMARPLRSFFSASRERLSLSDLRLLQSVYTELKHLRERYDLLHPLQSLGDIWIRTARHSAWWQNLLPQDRTEVLLTNFFAAPVANQKPMEQGLHELLADFLGQAYLQEFTAHLPQS